MLDWNPQPPYTAEQLLQVIRILRDPENGCPWRRQKKLPRKSPPSLPARPARSAARPSRTMHCSAISAAHSCKPITGKLCNRAVSPTGCRLFL